MRGLRAFLFTLWFWLWSAVMNILFLPSLALPRRVVSAGQRVWAAGISAGLARIVGLTWRAEGRRNLPPTPVIIACKHQAMWETIIWLLESPGSAIVMKRELMLIPFYGWYCRRSGQIPIDRSAGGAALKNMLRHARRARDDKRHIIIFPQGTRTASGVDAPYLPGVAALYRELDLPVVPVALNSGRFWGRKPFMKRPGEIVLQYLEPIPPGLPRKIFMARLKDSIETGVKRLEGGEK